MDKCNCKESILPYLSSLPSKWASQIVDVICKNLPDINCQLVKDCETNTSLGTFTIEGDEICITYTNEEGVVQQRCLDITDIINFEDTDTVDFSGSGTSLDPFKANVKISPAVGNIISNDGQGIFADDPNDGWFANNGLNKSISTTVQLGGSLTVPTTIVTSNTNTLSIEGLQGEDDPSWFITFGPDDDILRKTSDQDAASQLLSYLTVDNGLTKNTSTNFQLGGSLIKDTNIELNTHNLGITQYIGSDLKLFDITGEQGGSYVKYWGIREGFANNDILTQVKSLPTLFTVISATNIKQDSSSLPLEGYLSDAFLVVAGKDKKSILGVDVPTTDGFGEVQPDPEYLDSSFIRFLEGTGEIYSHYLTIGNDRFDGSGNVTDQNLGRLYIKNNVGIGQVPDDPNTFNPITSISNVNTKLKVFRNVGFTSSNFTSASSNLLYFTPENTNENISSPTTVYTGDITTLAPFINISNVNIIDDTVKVGPSSIYSAHIGNFLFVTKGKLFGVGGDTETPTGNFSCYASYPLFSNYDGVGGELDRIIGFRATSPIGDCNIGFTGNIGEVVGVQIDNQRTNDNTDLPCEINIVGNTYGVKQLGSNDINLFNGIVILQKVLDNGSLVDDTAAALANVPIGGLYHTAGTIKIRLV